MRYCFIFAFLALFLVACGGGTSGGQDQVAEVFDAFEVKGPDLPDALGPEDLVPQGEDVAIEEMTEGLEIEEVTGDLPPPPEVLALVEEGKKYLRDGESGFAMKAFRKALEVAPDYTDAIFGLALAELVYASELSVMAVSIGGQLSDPKAQATSTGIPPDTWSQNEYLAAQLHYIFRKLRDYFADASDLLGRIEGRGLSFEVEAVPVFLGIKPKLMYRGTFDPADVYLMRAIGDTIAGILDVFAGQDFSTDVLTITGFLSGKIGNLENPNISAHVLFPLIAYLLNEDPRFLTLHPDDGLVLFEDSGERFGRAGQSLLSAIEAMDEDEGKGVSWWKPQGDGGGTLYVCCRLRHEGDTFVEEVMEFALTKDILQAFEDASKSIRTPGYKVTLHGAVLPILATMLNVAAKVGAFEAFGLDLPIDIGSFELDAFAAFLGSLLPNVVAFDWGTFFEHPVGLRAWLPAVTNKGGGPFSDTVMAEWECPSDLDDKGFPSGKLGLICSKDAALEDAPHFVGTEYETQADGIASPLPVLAFDDPTLNGLLFVDLEAKPGWTDASSYKPADRTSINAAIAVMLSGIVNLLSGL